MSLLYTSLAFICLLLLDVTVRRYQVFSAGEVLSTKLDTCKILNIIDDT